MYIEDAATNNDVHALWLKTQSEPSALFKQIFDLSSRTVETARTGKKTLLFP